MIPHPVVDGARRAMSAWRADLQVSAWDADDHLRSLVSRYGLDEHVPVFSAFGAEVSTRIDAWATEANRDENLPRWYPYDGQGHREDRIVLHESTHAIGRIVWPTGVMARYRDAGHEIESLILLYQLAQDGEAGHCCPLACTAGLIRILQAEAAEDGRTDPAWIALRTAWLDRLLSDDYADRWHGAQFLTEVQGGSDVGANVVRASDQGDGTFRLTGEKWFCSVADAPLYLVSARPDDGRDGTRGVMAFVVPRTLPDGTRNPYRIRRLKTKLGTRSMASAEIDFEGAVGWPVGDFRRVVEVVLDRSRLYNAVCNAGMIQRAWREASAYARRRTAFGQPIGRFPAIARMVADLRAEAFAARGLTFRLAALADRVDLGLATPELRGAGRMLVNLNKYWTSHVATGLARTAIEVFGGNGAIEDFSVLPRLLRDSVVTEAWEGGHNVLCAQALRDATKLQLHRPMFAFLRDHATSDRVRERLDAEERRWGWLVEQPAELASLHVRDVADRLRPVAQAAILEAEATDSAIGATIRVAVDHLLRGDPLEDAGLASRIEALNQPAAG